MSRSAPAWDVFRRVVDNFGDAGVCWRLARQLADEHGARVRLWIDDVESLRRLNPAVEQADRQLADGVQVWTWREPLSGATPADIVVEAFGCGLPEEYVSTMAAAAPPPLWIVLEYLSAEPWVTKHHALPSPHPRLPLERYFFFPGFVAGTGGLLREADLFARRDLWRESGAEAFWRSMGHAPVASNATAVSLFSYDTAPTAALMRAWERSDRPVVCAIPEDSSAEPVLRELGIGRKATPAAIERGALEIRVVPFLPQVRYDELLWTCDCNFVRGEDSFVRAQWSARGFVWQAYRQADGAHCRKLDAFLSLYGAGLPASARDAVENMMRVWNQVEGCTVTPAAAWDAYAAQLPALLTHGRRWADQLSRRGDLAATLARFCREKLK